MKWIGPLLTSMVLLTACGNAEAATAPAPAPGSNVAADASPVGLDIAAIGVKVTQLPSTGPGSGTDERCPTDPQVVIWNSTETAPGDPGLAELTSSGQGAFKRLSELGGDDAIVVARSDGTTATFKKNAPLPVPHTPSASLVLKTCGGTSTVTVFTGRVG